MIQPVHQFKMGYHAQYRIKEDLLFGLRCLEHFPHYPYWPYQIPIPVSHSVGHWLSHWQSGGRKETNINWTPNMCHTLGLTLLWIEDYLTPVTSPEGRKWNYGWGNRGSAKSSHCLVRGRTRCFFRPSKWSLMSSETLRNVRKFKTETYEK